MEHIAIFRPPLFDFVLNGKKTIESRWSKNKIAPFNKVSEGDTIYIKKTGCPVIAKCFVKKVEYYNLTPQIAEEIKSKYGKEICIDYFDNWEECKQKNYCTLIWIEKVTTIEPRKVKRSGGSGWLVLK